MARAARHDDAVELVLAHLCAQRPVAALIFLFGEMIIDRIAVIGRCVHVGERRVLVEACAHLFPRLVTGRAGLDVHRIQSLQFPMVTAPPAASTASLASAIFATCSTVGFLSLSISPFSALLSIDHCVRAGSKPVLIDQTQLVVSTSIAYSTASFGVSVAFSMIGTTLALSLNMARLASIIAAAVSRSSGRSRAIQSSEAP